MLLIRARKLSKVPESPSLVKQSRGMAVLCKACSKCVRRAKNHLFSQQEREREPKETMLSALYPKFGGSSPQSGLAIPQLRDQYDLFR